MNLFDDTDLFSSGERKTTVFDLPDTDLVLHQNFFSKPESDAFYYKLLNDTPWEEFDWTVYGKTHVAPRMTCWYEDASNPGAKPDKTSWPKELLEIRKRIETESGVMFNSVLLNLYRDGKDCVGWHSDRKDKFGENQIIGSVSFGETRPFRLRHKTRKDIPMVEIPLHHGSFLLMAGTTQTFWEHQIPRTAKDILPRINLTFRRVIREIS